MGEYSSIVDVSASTVSDWKLGHCTRNPLLSRESCCRDRPESADTTCEQFELWTDGYTTSFAIYVGMAVVFGIISSGVTMLTKTTLPVAELEDLDSSSGSQSGTKGKVMYMAAGSGIPE
jgi:chloride channel 3/4/5